MPYALLMKPKRPEGMSYLFWLSLLLKNEIAGLTRGKDEAVFTTAAQLAEWASRNKKGEPMREAKDFVTTAEEMVNAAKGGGEKKE